MDELSTVACAHELLIIEDGSQAHGAEWDGKPVGSIGDVGAFSFYPTKNLAALGDGGALVCDDTLQNRARKLRQYGWEDRHVSSEIAMNTRLDEVQAAVLNHRLTTFRDRNDRRRVIAEVYTDAFSQIELALPSESAQANAVYHQYVVRSSRRSGLEQYLAGKEIGASVLYPVPLHQQPAFKNYPRSSSLSLSGTATAELLCLPIYPELTDLELERITNTVLAFHGG